MRFASTTNSQPQLFQQGLIHGLPCAFAAQPERIMHPLESLQRKSIPGRMLNQRNNVLLFVKILLRFLDQTSNRLLQLQAKAAIAECVQRNRMGDSKYIDLQKALELQLTAVLGYPMYTRVQRYCYLQCRKEGFST